MPFRHTQKALQYPAIGTVPAIFPIQGPVKDELDYPIERKEVRLRSTKYFIFENNVKRKILNFPEFN